MVINLPEKRAGIFPNPGSGTISIAFEIAETGNIKVFSLQRQLLHSVDFNAKMKVEIDMSAFPAGLYFVHISAGDTIVSKMLMLK
jgi:hypothetical protein